MKVDIVDMDTYVCILWGDGVNETNNLALIKYLLHNNYIFLSHPPPPPSLQYLREPSKAELVTVLTLTETGMIMSLDLVKKMATTG